MTRLTVFCAALALAGPAAAGADTLTVFDENGAETEMDTTAIRGCEIVFDSAGTPFEICRMKRVELTPPKSNRARPGQTSAAGEAEPVRAAVVYRRVED